MQEQEQRGDLERTARYLVKVFVVGLILFVVFMFLSIAVIAK